MRTSTAKRLSTISTPTFVYRAVTAIAVKRQQRSDFPTDETLNALFTHTDRNRDRDRTGNLIGRTPGSRVYSCNLTTPLASAARTSLIVMTSVGENMREHAAGRPTAAM